jgi:hypothetical protein
VALQSIQVTQIDTKGNCSEVPFGRNFTECIEKCYEGDVIIPVPRPTIELPRAVRGSVFSSGDDSIGPTEVRHTSVALMLKHKAATDGISSTMHAPQQGW